MNTSTPLACASDAGRREQVRRAASNGLDFVEVDEAQTTLTVTFLGRAPAWITAAHLRIEGGRRERNLRVLRLQVQAADDEGLDDHLLVTVDRPGDFSTYRLRVVRLDDSGRPTDHLPEGFDPRYVCVDFSFKASCPSDLDCSAAPPCPPPVLNEPAIDYLAKDYASFRRLMLDRLALTMPQWTERHVPDVGITLVELLAYVGDHLSYQQDAVATEAYLDTARLRTSVRRHLRLVDYALHEGCNARTWLVADVDDGEVLLRAADFFAITRHPDRAEPLLKLDELPLTEPLPYTGFQPRLAVGQDGVRWRQVRNSVDFYTWGETACCLARGAVSATLVDPGEIPKPAPDPDPDPDSYPKPRPRPDADCAPPAAQDAEAGIADGRWHLLKLQPGEVLVFEEMLGPHTGNPADADPQHRHAVRLTRATPSWDPLTRQLLVEVEWCLEDALPFPLCLSATSDPPACAPLTKISVARGNVLLVDHGLNATEKLGPAPEGAIVATCASACADAEVRATAARWRPSLSRADVTLAQPHAPDTLNAACGGCGPASATGMLRQDVSAAVPQMMLHCDEGGFATRWEARADLLDSGPDDRHFVVEIDDLRRAWLRFGDGSHGRALEPQTVFEAAYRVGSGPAGNVGAEGITQLVFRNAFPDGAGIRVRNPMAAVGGTPPEPVAQARLRAPQALRQRLERAVTPADYAAIVLRDFPDRVQRAAAQWRASSATVEVRVAIDALGTRAPSATLLACIERHLQAYRRIGHDVRVVAARAVAVDLALHICVKPHVLRGHVKDALVQALGNGRLQDGAPAFFHPDALTLGQALYVSRIVAVAQAVDGVAGVIVQRLQRLYETANGELTAGFLAIGALEVARLDNDPVNPENGQLTLMLEGGR